MNATRAAVEEGYPAWGRRRLVAGEQGAVETEDPQRRPEGRHRRRPKGDHLAGPADRNQCGGRRLGDDHQDPRYRDPRLWLQRPNRRVWGPDGARHYRPRQGGARGAPGRGLRGRPPHHPPKPRWPKCPARHRPTFRVTITTSALATWNSEPQPSNPLTSARRAEIGWECPKTKGRLDGGVSREPGFPATDFLWRRKEHRPSNSAF